ncbi:14-3-3 protein, partial [Saccharata proteae CBS 121410]
MASSDVDQKFLGRLAKYTATSNPLLSASLYQVLGLSVLLSRKLFRARKLRKLDTSRDTKSLALYHHILWLSREGLTILEMNVLPYTQDGQLGPEGRVLSAKLRASFYHVFCLFHNQPPLSTLNAPINTSNTTIAGTAPTPLSPRKGNANQSRQKENNTIKQPHLREPINSITSETSFLTNPYATPPPHATSTIRPPGLSAPAQPGNSSAFLLPPLNFVPLSLTHFTTASNLSSTLLPGSHPLRLSVALEHAAFLWDIARDRTGARRLARRAIRDVYRAQEGMDDGEFEDAAQLVSLLGGIMRRGSLDSTPKAGNAGFGKPPTPQRTSTSLDQQHRLPSIPPQPHS